MNRTNADADVPVTTSELPAAAAADVDLGENSTEQQIASEGGSPGEPPVQERVPAGSDGANSMAAPPTGPTPRASAPEPTPGSQDEPGENSASNGCNFADPVPVLAQQLAAELLPLHPEPGLPGRAAPAIEKVLSAAADPDATASRIRRNHEAWRERWATYPAGRFIPQLWRFFRDGDWQLPPPKPAQREERESWTDRKKRERREYDEKTWQMYAENEMWEALERDGQDPEVWRARVKAAS